MTKGRIVGGEPPVAIHPAAVSAGALPSGGAAAVTIGIRVRPPIPPARGVGNPGHSHDSQTARGGTGRRAEARAAKAAAILDAARAIRVAQRLAGPSIEAAAGVSRVTICRPFGDRPGLRAALAARETRWLAAAQAVARFLRLWPEKKAGLAPGQVQQGGCRAITPTRPGDSPNGTIAA
jgi:hypothetical protein